MCKDKGLTALIALNLFFYVAPVIYVELVRPISVTVRAGNIKRFDIAEYT
jgi:hypothetical protein